jgi:hypothetical protein
MGIENVLARTARVTEHRHWTLGFSLGAYLLAVQHDTRLL